MMKDLLWAESQKLHRSKILWIAGFLILFCVLELGDGEIGDLMGMSRSAVQRHRAKTLNELRKKLKAHLPEGG